MVILDKITMVAVASVRVPETIKALQYSMKDIKFGSVKLFTHEDVFDDNIEVIKIDKLDYENYNRFIVFNLHKFIDTEFCLIIQDDGFVVNAKSWRDEFYNYDYIGAPWPLPKDNFSFLDDKKNLVRVGNGGFSLRSKKILSLATELNLPWQAYYGYHNEDGFFCCHNKSVYEDNGCVYAPIDVAKYFSHEIAIPEIANIAPFGFHGKHSNYCNLIR